MITTAQWYAVSTSQPPGASPAPTPPSATSAAGTAAERQPRMRNSTATAATTRAIPRPTMIPLTGTREISTKPVTHRADDRADGADPGQPADHPAGLASGWSAAAW